MDRIVKGKLDNFFTKYKFQEYKRGGILIKAGDTPNGIFYLKEGIVRQYSISKSGEELTLNVYKPTSFFPMSWAFNNTPNNYYYEALALVKLWQAPKKDVLRFIKDEPEVLYDLIKRIYKGLEGYMMQMEFLMAGSASAKLVACLLIYAKRFGKEQNKKIIINMKLTQQEIASQTGLTRETVNREIQNLKKQRLVGFNKNKFEINNIYKLEEKLNET